MSKMTHSVISAASITALRNVHFDHLVGERHQFVWDRQVERLGSSEIDYELKFSCLNNWQIGGPCAA